MVDATIDSRTTRGQHDPAHSLHAAARLHYSYLDGSMVDCIPNIVHNCGRHWSPSVAIVVLMHARIRV